jgi:5-methyltetrahydrofolate--homocysteine methyltransferase
LKKYAPGEIINSIIIPAMNTDGEKFSKGEYIVTEVLSFASVSQRAIDLLKPHIKKVSFKKYKLLIATVKGDVHDIGKNLVSIIIESNGYDIIDLGTKVEPEVIVDKAISTKSDFIGLSRLLARSSEYMIETAVKLKEKNLSIPLILGGAALSKNFVNIKIKPIYKNSFYAKDAIEGVRIANTIKK